MSVIHVCPLSSLEDSLATHAPKWMISLSGPGKTPARPSQIDRGFLPLEFNDIGEEREGLIAPDLNHITQILSFADEWDGLHPLLVHCWMGISRSTAAALLICAQKNPNQNMQALAASLRALSPMATPNPLMVSIGDQVLQLEGRLIEAVSTIGRGVEAYEGRPFSVSVAP